MGKNIQRFGNLLSERMQSTATANQHTTLEFGTINADMSLKVDSLTGNIGPNDYMINFMLAHGSYETEESEHTHSDGQHEGHAEGDGSHKHEGGRHVHRLPSVFRRIRAGDRVLVAWVGYEPVVISVVVSGTTVTR